MSLQSDTTADPDSFSLITRRRTLYSFHAPLSCT